MLQDNVEKVEESLGNNVRILFKNVIYVSTPPVLNGLVSPVVPYTPPVAKTLLLLKLDVCTPLNIELPSYGPDVSSIRGTFPLGGSHSFDVVIPDKSEV
jgi:hypothetical protein